jgi:hypothetical protein
VDWGCRGQSGPAIREGVIGATYPVTFRPARPHLWAGAAQLATVARTVWVERREALSGDPDRVGLGLRGEHGRGAGAV